MNKLGKNKKKESQYIRGICIVCNKNKQKASGICKKGKNKGLEIYKNVCAVCHIKKNPEKYNDLKKETNLRKRPWFKYKKSFCEQCGFIAVHACQLDVDHVDGNKQNNSPDNYRTLCSNCHRLKTFVNGEWALRYRKCSKQ